MVDIAVDADSGPFWEGVANGELRLQRCSGCGSAVFYPRTICPHCFGDDLQWFGASGVGTVYSYTRAHRAFGEFEAQAPFVVALVDLEEGVRMLTRVVGDEVRIGDRVRLEVVRLGDESSPELPCFRLVDRA